MLLDAVRFRMSQDALSRAATRPVPRFCVPASSNHRRVDDRRGCGGAARMLISEGGNCGPRRHRNAATVVAAGRKGHRRTRWRMKSCEQSDVTGSGRGREPGSGLNRGLHAENPTATHCRSKTADQWLETTGSGITREHASMRDQETRIGRPTLAHCLRLQIDDGDLNRCH